MMKRKYAIIEYIQYTLEEGVIIIPKFNELPDVKKALYLENVSLKIWNGLIEGDDDTTIIEKICIAYKVEREECKKDFEEFIAELLKNGFIQ